MKTGVFKDSIEEYHSQPHLSSTPVRAMVKSAAHFDSVRKGKFEITDPLIFGNLAHAGVIERRFDYVVRPVGIDGRTKAGKEQLEQLKALGKPLVDQADDAQIKAMSESFWSVASVAKLCKGAEIETSLYAIDPETGLPVRARPDIRKLGLLIDYKTVADMNQFTRHVWKYGYNIQAGFYALVDELVTGVPVKEFLFIAQEKTAPYGVRVFRINGSLLATCKSEARILLNRCAVAIQTNSFPSYDEVITDLEMPDWALIEGFGFEEAM